MYKQQKHLDLNLITLIILLSSYYMVSVLAAPLELEAASSPFWSSNQGWLIGVVTVVVSLVLVGVALMVCMDCMNSEVSSESHPACADGTPKWGGAANYHRAGSGEGGTDSCFVSEVVHPSDLRNAPLPYSMVPTQVPSAPEFRGYQSGGDTNGMAGYSLPYAGAAPAVAGYGPNTNLSGGTAGYATNSGVGAGNSGRHYNPAQREDPPPAYSEALNH